jgi:hypothetical protein
VVEAGRGVARSQNLLQHALFDPQHRGHGISLLVMRALILRLRAGAGLIAVKAFPLDDCGRFHEVYGHKRELAETTYGAERLSRHFGRLGFKSLPNSHFMVLYPEVPLVSADSLTPRQFIAARWTLTDRHIPPPPRPVNRLRLSPGVLRSPEPVMATIRDCWIEFQQYLDSDTPPPLTDADSALRDDPAWAGSALAYLEEKRAGDAADERLEAARKVLVALSAHRETGSGVSVVRLWKAGNVDYKRVPELRGVELDRFRSEGRQEIRVTVMK